MPPQIEKSYLIELHGTLSTFHDLLTHTTIPHSYEAPGCQEVRELMEFIENLTDQQRV